VVTRGIELDQSSLLVKAQATVATVVDEVDNDKTHDKVIDGGVAMEGERGEVDEAVDIEYGEEARGVNEDEVAGKGRLGGV